MGNRFLTLTRPMRIPLLFQYSPINFYELFTGLYLHRVRMRIAGIYLQLFYHGVPQATFGQHPLDSTFNYPLRLLL